MKSVTLLRLDTSGGKVELATVARDYAPLWMTSVAIVEEGWFLGAEDSGNIVGWRRNDELNPDESRLTMSHEMRFGEMINRIRIGITHPPFGLFRRVFEMGGLMVGGLSGSEVQGVETKALFATVDGTIGIVASLSEEKFLLLEKVEKKMEEQDMSLGGIEHSRYPPPLRPFSRPCPPRLGIDGRWRAFTNGRKKALRSNGFIDGDFVEGFLDLDRVARGKV
jgi:DNA damage-binding protein 1